MQVVCRIFQGQFIPGSESSGHVIRLEDFFPFATTVYNHKPYMVKYRQQGITLLIFNNLKFRIMGQGEAPLSVLNEFMDRLPPAWKDELKVENLKLSTMTVVHTLPTPINPHKLCRDFTKFHAEWELFPAVKWLGAGGGVHVNIFHTGKVVATGVKSIYNAENDLLPRLYHDIHHALHSGCPILSSSTTTESSEGGHLHVSPTTSSHETLCFPTPLPIALTVCEGFEDSQLCPSKSGCGALECGRQCHF
jgi:TATA-box binding protein (TBP) (component of TFIID and TFIIIB)